MSAADFLNENGQLFSRIEEIRGQILLLRSQNKSQKNRIEGLNYEVQQNNVQLERLRKTNKTLRERVAILEAEQEAQRKFMPQNFKIKNSFSKLVTEIQESENFGSDELGNFLDVLIEEVDFCIDQLSK